MCSQNHIACKNYCQKHCICIQLDLYCWKQKKKLKLQNTYMSLIIFPSPWINFSVSSAFRNTVCTKSTSAVIFPVSIINSSRFLPCHGSLSWENKEIKLLSWAFNFFTSSKQHTTSVKCVTEELWATKVSAFWCLVIPPSFTSVEHHWKDSNIYSGTPPYDHPIYMTTSVLWPYSFDPNVNISESFCYFEDSINATTSLLRTGPSIYTYIAHIWAI